MGLFVETCYENAILEPVPFRVWDRFHLAEWRIVPVLQTWYIGLRCRRELCPEEGGGWDGSREAHPLPCDGPRLSCPDALLSPVSAKHFVVGLDAGGSNTLLLAECDGCPTRIDRQGPGANPHRTGVEQSAGILATLVREALQPHGPVDRLSVCAGVAGAGRSEEQEALATHLRRVLADDAGAVHVEVVHDACIALEAAFGSGSGLAVIAGTGSVVFGRARDGTTHRTGGWGYVLGDPGSGYAVGRAGLRAVAAAFDGGADTSLRARVDERWGIGGREVLIRRVHRDEFALQDVAPLVMEAAANGDAVAADILTSQADALMEQLEWLLDGTDDIAPRIALLGGMLRNGHYAEVLRRTLRTRVPGWSAEVLRHEPVVGALRRAHSLDT